MAVVCTVPGELVIGGGLGWELLLIVKDSTIDGELEMAGGFNEGTVPTVGRSGREFEVTCTDSDEGGVLVANVSVRTSRLEEGEEARIVLIDDLIEDGRTVVSEGWNGKELLVIGDSTGNEVAVVGTEILEDLVLAVWLEMIVVVRLVDTVEGVVDTAEELTVTIEGDILDIVLIVGETEEGITLDGVNEGVDVDDSVLVERVILGGVTEGGILGGSVILRSVSDFVEFESVTVDGVKLGCVTEGCVIGGRITVETVTLGNLMGDVVEDEGVTERGVAEDKGGIVVVRVAIETTMGEVSGGGGVAAVTVEKIIVGNVIVEVEGG